MSNPRMPHVLLDAEVLVINACSRFICMKKKNHHHCLLRKDSLLTLMSHETYIF